MSFFGRFPLLNYTKYIFTNILWRSRIMFHNLHAQHVQKERLVIPWGASASSSHESAVVGSSWGIGAYITQFESVFWSRSNLFSPLKEELNSQLKTRVSVCFDWHEYLLNKCNKERCARNLFVWKQAVLSSSNSPIWITKHFFSL